MHRFYWLVEGAIAGCSRPGAGDGRPGEASPAQLDADLSWLRHQHIEAVLSLTETPIDADALSRQGMESFHVPVPDLTPPTPEQMMQALIFVDLQRALGRAVAIHCLMGQGRTATVLAAYLIRGGASADAALAEVRELCPGAVGSPQQELALQAFAARRDWVY